MNKATARKLAQQIHTRFGARIAAACEGTPVPPEFVAGLIGNEAGKDRSGQIVENATRYEAHVFRRLQQVRDGLRKSWSNIRQADIKDSDDAALRALATSYSLTQIMGWHCIHNLDCTIADLRGPNHLRYTVKLLMMNAADGDFQRAAYAGEFREWNTGKEGGKTYHADYVKNGEAVMAAYRELGPVEPEPEPVVVVEETPAPAAPAINVEHASQVNAATAPVPGGHKDDPPIQATQGGRKSMIATAIATVAGIGTAIKGALQGDQTLIIIGIVCATVVLIALIFRQIIIDYVRLNYMSDPQRMNVK